VGDDLGGGLGDGGSQPERLDSPLQIALPALLLQGQAFAQGGFVNLHASTPFAKSVKELLTDWVLKSSNLPAPAPPSLARP
jgi:hypothetical protein